MPLLEEDSAVQTIWYRPNKSLFINDAMAATWCTDGLAEAVSTDNRSV